MRFFERCKRIYMILRVLNIFLGVYIGYELYQDIILWKHIDMDNYKLFFIIVVWIFLMIINLILKCIIKDAQEDLNAILGVIKNND